MARAGYRVIAFDVYPAEIRGFGECIACSRITSDQVFSLKALSDVLVSLNDGHAIAHVPEVRDYGALIYDDAPITTLKEGSHISGHIKPGQLPYGLPMREISERATNAAKSRNMVALGFVAGLYGMPREVFHETIAAKFKGKARRSPRATSRPSMPATRRAARPSSSISSTSARPASPSPERS